MMDCAAAVVGAVESFSGLWDRARAGPRLRPFGYYSQTSVWLVGGDGHDLGCEGYGVPGVGCLWHLEPLVVSAQKLNLLR